MFWIVWNKDRSEGFVTNDYDDAFQASTGQFNSIRSSIGESFFEAYGDEIEETGNALEIQEVGAIAVADAAVQIAEEAFRAGFKAGEHWDTRKGAPSRGELEERAWGAFEPSEATKELIA